MCDKIIYIAGESEEIKMIYDELAMNNGVIFQRTYNILNEKMRQGIINIKNGSSGADGMATLDAALIVSVIVNCSFACELFLKSMLHQDTRGHKLDELFSKLDDTIQENIKMRTIDEMKKTTSGYCDTDFQRDLTQNSNKFAEWRYFHEVNTQTANLEFVSRFMKSTFSVVNEERKK